MSQWAWEYRPGEVVEKTTLAGLIREPQPFVPCWSWQGEAPTQRVQLLGARRARADR